MGIYNHIKPYSMSFHLPASLVLMILVVFSPFRARANEIIKVTVLNQKSIVIAVIETDESINQFEALWDKKQILDNVVDFKWSYKINILHKNRSTTWLYDPNGYVQVLTKAKVPLYTLPSPDQFNLLVIGDIISSTEK